jgi:serine/threonine protein phosphatase PrpC
MAEVKDVDTTEYEIGDLSEAIARVSRREVRFEFAAISDPGRVRTHNEDHYLVTRMSRSFRAEMTNMPEDVHRHATRHVLTNFVGGPSPGVEPEIATLQVRDGDVLLLCSDGLTEMVPDPEIAGILGQAGTPDAASRALVARALANGGRDNVTVVLARFEVEAPG